MDTQQNQLNEIRNLVGQGAGAMLGRSIWGQAKKEFGNIQDEKIKKEMVKDFVDFYGKNIVNESTLIKGVKEFLIWAKENNISMAVCTNKQEHLAIDLLKKIRIFMIFLNTLLDIILLIIVNLTQDI